MALMVVLRACNKTLGPARTAASSGQKYCDSRVSRRNAKHWATTEEQSLECQAQTSAPVNSFTQLVKPVLPHEKPSLGERARFQILAPTDE